MTKKKVEWQEAKEGERLCWKMKESEETCRKCKTFPCPYAIPIGSKKG